MFLAMFRQIQYADISTNQSLYNQNVDAENTDNMETRKQNRLKAYDYSQNGYYFITICTAEKSKLLCEISVGANCVRPKMTLSEIGKLVDDNIGRLNGIYENVRVDKYVVMPNHVHLILAIQSGRTQFAPTVSRMIKQFKGRITKQVGFCIWQKSFYDHVIRDEKDYLRIAEYIDTNPAKWTEDKYFIPANPGLSS